nr:zinc finger protein JACKDAW isoform X2 [Ipomoea trifida]
MMSGDVFSIPSSLKPTPPPQDPNPNPKPNPSSKKKRNLPGKIALSPTELSAMLWRKRFDESASWVVLRRRNSADSGGFPAEFPAETQAFAVARSGGGGGREFSPPSSNAGEFGGAFWGVWVVVAGDFADGELSDDVWVVADGEFWDVESLAVASRAAARAAGSGGDGDEQGGDVELDKAAQMGSTKSSAPTAFFGNSFGLMTSSSSSSNNRSELQHMMSQNNNGFDIAAAENSSCLMQRQQGVSLNGVNVNAHHLTRDFLGMGSEDGRPFLAEELAKFASSMGSAAMGLSHFSIGH